MRMDTDTGKMLVGERGLHFPPRWAQHKIHPLQRLEHAVGGHTALARETLDLCREGIDQNR